MHFDGWTRVQRGVVLNILFVDSVTSIFSFVLPTFSHFAVSRPPAPCEVDTILSAANYLPCCLCALPAPSVALFSPQGRAGNPNCLSSSNCGTYYVSHAPMCPEGLTLSQRCYVLWTRKDLVFGIPVSLGPSVELEVAHCSKFVLERSRAEPENAGLWTGQSALQGELFPLPPRSRLSSTPTVPSSRERSVIWVEQHRSQLLDTYVLCWMGEDAFDALCFCPSENRAACYSTYR